MPPMDLTPEEARHIRRRRTSEKRDGYFRQGLEAAATEIMQWDGVISSEPDRAALADAVRKLKRPRKKDALPT